MKDFFIADTHFESEDIIKMENRPFKSACEMNHFIVSNWNNVVKENDRVFLLGDVGELKTDENIKNVISILKSLNGHIILILGNHDREFKEFFKDFPNIEVYNFPILYNDFWMLSHEPLYVSETMPYANIFGHVHNNPMYKTVSCRSFCVSVERINYTPICFDEIKEKVLNCEK